MRINMQFFGGRGSSSASGGSAASASGRPLTINDFNHPSENVWESKKQAVNAAALVMSSEGEPSRLVSTKGPAFKIHKVGSMYRVYKASVIGGRRPLKSVRSLEAALKIVNDNV